jgi:hypothetical protein
MKPLEDGRRETGALGLSVLLHLCAIPLFAAIFVEAPIPLPEAVSVTSGAFSATIEHRETHHAQAQTVAHAAPAPQHVAVRPAPSKAVVKTTQTSARRAAGHPRHEAQQVAVAAPAEPQAQPAVERATEAPAPEAAPDNVASRVPTSAPTEASNPGPAPSAEVGRSVEPAPPGGWGQNFRDPTVLDDNAVKDLRARYPQGIVAHIQVDADGHPVKVSIDGGGLDPDARAEIERQLSALRYVPAECNGLPCAATFDLRV